MRLRFVDAVACALIARLIERALPLFHLDNRSLATIAVN
jgi:hypothetical protein